MLLAGRARGARRVAMTPLIDIVFILLLFFILETSFSEFRQMGLALTGASAGAQSGPVPLRLEV
ncbi:MAG: biopolymer transporter ExbD, partial [Pseudomonadales bacterium]